jgi:hypothetical protein
VIQPVWITVEYGPIEPVEGHLEYGWVYTCNWIPDPPCCFLPMPIGGGDGPQPPAEVTTLQAQYSDCSETPAVADFINSSQYVNPGDFTFDELRDPDYNYAIITDGLRNGLQAIRNAYGSVNVTSAYRAPGTNAGTSGSVTCSSHMYGKSADLSIRNASGQHDCAISDALALAAHNAGGWVESWAELVARKTPDHVHVEFGRAANSDYGTCNPAELK